MDKRLTSITPSTLVRSLGDFLMPRVCVVCGRPLLVQERHLCVVCLFDLPFTYFWSMPHNPMADRFNGIIEADEYIHAAALFYYSGGYESITQALKYRRNFAVGRWAAGILGLRLRESGWQIDAVCCVPLHWTRRWRRGYNQAEIIGRQIASRLGVPFLPRLLRRLRRTSAQTRLSGSARLSNVSGAFTVRQEILSQLFPPEGCGNDSPEHASSEGKVERGSRPPEPLSILIVDDVFTTGSTLAACYKALRNEYGDGMTIAVATLAYVE